jgi:hypothetical protein
MVHVCAGVYHGPGLRWEGAEQGAVGRLLARCTLAKLTARVTS